MLLFIAAMITGAMFAPQIADLLIDWYQDWAIRRTLRRHAARERAMRQEVVTAAYIKKEPTKYTRICGRCGARYEISCLNCGLQAPDDPPDAVVANSHFGTYLA